MRIVSGSFRGRRLQTPQGEETRPTSDRAREGVFNILEHGAIAARGSLIVGASVADAYAGTGAMGLEALSRGASHATFFEVASSALGALRANIKALGVTAKSLVINANAAQPPRAKTPCGLLFFDPPYEQNLGPISLEAFAEQGWMAAGAIAVLETGTKEKMSPPAGFTLLDERTYGAARFFFLRYGEASSS